MNRRKFIQSIAIGSLVLTNSKLLLACENPKRKWKFVRSGIPIHFAHAIREQKPVSIGENIQKHRRIIIGGGISGLSVAYHLQEAGNSDFLLLEMESQFGGNAQYGETKTGKFPQGAHYLPIQNKENSPLLQFLHKTGIITHFSHDGIPYYKEDFLCHEPEDRLFIHGKWHDGLVESLVKLFPEEKKTWDRFFHRMDFYKNEIGSDGKPIFSIPNRFSSLDPKYQGLDHISFAQFLDENQFRSRSLDWYLNYCCRDDYGQDTAHISAFAGIHYFAARRGSSKNCDANSLLTWPEGNGFLAQKLANSLGNRGKLNTLVRQIQKTENDSYLVHTKNWKTNQEMTFEAKELILCVPIHIRKHLLKEITSKNWLIPSHQPWWVATIEITPFSDFSGAPLAWDNIIFEHETLGYIHNLNQQMSRPNGNTLLTFYKALNQNEAKKLRAEYLQKSDEALKEEILDQIRSIYPDIENHIQYMEVRLWGHGMVSPGINYLTNPKRLKQQKSFQHIHFAHTDDVGFSLFEEAFDLGFQLANQLVNDNKNVDSL